MAGTFRAVGISEHVHWVGAIDWGLRNFHGYLTSRGTTYNAYLILGDEPILIDTVKAPFKDEMLSRIASVVEPGKIKTIISNHTEMDHSGCLAEMIDLVGPERVLASAVGAKDLREHFRFSREITPVKNGETMSIGGASLTFTETRMLHWPDSMFTFYAEDGVLFSQDAFGLHLASNERFADDLDRAVVEHEAAKYYANIILPYSALVEPLLKKLPELGLDIRLLAPDHGPVWRGAENISAILALYADWAAQRRKRSAVVVYDTMWQSTAKMARASAEGLASGGAAAEVMPLGASHRSDVATEILDAGALIVGSPTMNNNVFPTVADTLTYLKGLRPRGLAGAAFGSYGWGGEAVGQIEQVLREMKVEIVAEAGRARYVPGDEDLARCREFGEKIAAALG